MAKNTYSYGRLDLLASNGNPEQFLTDCMDSTDMPLSERIDIAKYLLPFKKPKLLAQMVSVAVGEQSFEAWLERLNGPGREAIDRALLSLQHTSADTVTLDDDPEGSA